jgi:hypothetical protein
MAVDQSSLVFVIAFLWFISRGKGIKKKPQGRGGGGACLLFKKTSEVDFFALSIVFSRFFPVAPWANPNIVAQDLSGF